MISLKGPEALNVKMTSARGLVGEAYSMRPGIVDVFGTVLFTYIPLKAGEETPVLVIVPDLPRNANVELITAELQVSDAMSSPPPDKASVKIRQGTGSETALTVITDAPTRPRNVSIRLDQGEPLWNFGGSLVKDSYDVPNFAQQLNAFLDKVKPNADGSVTLNFLVKSDTVGAVKIRIAEKRLSRLQTQTWPNELDQTLRVDRNLQLEFGQRHELPLDAIQGQPALTAIRMDVGGTFGAERMLGPAQEHAGHDFATISSDYAVAQGLVLDKAMKAVGISGAFVADGEAELYVELQPDANGAPAADAPLAKSNLTLRASASAATPWVYAAFAAPADLSADTSYWIVVKGVRGNVRLGVDTDEESYLRHVVVNRSGKLWKRFDHSATPYVSLVRLVYLPETDNQSAAVRVGVNESLWQGVDPGPTPTSMAFALGGAGISAAAIVIESQARGALTLANVTQEY